MIFKNWI